MKNWKITTKIRPGIKDVEGATAERRFRDNGWDVSDLHVGQVFLITGDEKTVKELAHKHLVNIQLYDYEIEEV